MSDDILREASRALRDTTAEDNQGDRFTRARIMSSLHQRRQRRSTRLALLVPLAAILVGSTAWAGATGKLPQVWIAVAETIGVQVSEQPGETAAEAKRAVAWAAKRPAAQAKELLEPQEEESAHGTEAATENLPDDPSAHPGQGADSHRTGATDKAKAAPSESEPDEHLLYRAAHRAHFEQRDSAAALRAWDEYLRVAPGGRFSVEARYNRALCLVRLGRNAEARAALAPFARGAYGNYRQREARELVEALGGEAP